MCSMLLCTEIRSGVYVCVCVCVCNITMCTYYMLCVYVCVCVCRYQALVVTVRCLKGSAPSWGGFSSQPATSTKKSKSNTFHILLWCTAHVCG